MGQRLETKTISHLSKEFHVPSALIAKVEVASDGNQLCVERSHEICRNEFGRCFLRPLFIEAHDKCNVNTTFRKQLKLLVEIGEKQRRRLGSND